MIAVSKKPEVSLASLIRDWTAYNLWANKVLTDWLQTKPCAMLNKEVPSSFRGIKPTLIHMCNTQRFWLSVLRRDYLTQRKNSEEDSVEQVMNDLIDQSLEFSTYVDQLTDHQLQEEVELITPWYSTNHQRFEYIQNCMNHSTYHRGQLITIGHLLGFEDAPMTDYHCYLLNTR